MMDIFNEMRHLAGLNECMDTRKYNEASCNEVLHIGYDRQKDKNVSPGMNIPAPNEPSNPVSTKKYPVTEGDVEPMTCDKCGNDSFKNTVEYGGGGSGTYLTFTCNKCGNQETMDFENPDYEG